MKLNQPATVCVWGLAPLQTTSLCVLESVRVYVCVCAHECGGQRVFTEELSISLETRPSKSGLGVVEHYFRYVKLCYIYLCCELFT